MGPFSPSTENMLWLVAERDIFSHNNQLLTKCETFSAAVSEEKDKKEEKKEKKELTPRVARLIYHTYR